MAKVRTAKQKAALKKAQAASARKRRGTGKAKKKGPSRFRRAAGATGRHFKRNAHNYIGYGVGIAIAARRVEKEFGITKGRRSDIRRAKARNEVKFKKAIFGPALNRARTNHSNPAFQKLNKESAARTRANIKKYNKRKYR